MSKVAEAMKVYKIVLVDHTLVEAKVSFDKEGFIVINEKDSDEVSLAELIVEGLVDPRDIFKDLLKVRYRTKWIDSEETVYLW